jgi:chromatin segregation and condensation protein Rec8/ScpA/Scc1 (kleisin family)
MAAMLIEIKSRMLLPPKKSATDRSPRIRAPNSCGG